MKKIALIISAVIASSAAVKAAPLFTIGDQVDVFFNGAVIGRWDSNMYLKTANKIDDYSYTFRLGFEANYGRNSKFKASVRFYEDLVRYVSQTHANNNQSNVFANASYSEERWSVVTHFSFRQVAQNTESMVHTTNDLIRRDLFTAGIKGTYDITDKLNTEVGFLWYRETFRDNPATLGGYLYSDRDTYSLPFSLLYRVTEKINAGLTYQYRTTEYSKGNFASLYNYGNNLDDHFVGITVRGELFPRLSTETTFGWGFRDLYEAEGGAGREEHTFTFSSRFDYLVTDKLSVYALGFRDFGNGAARQATINTGMRVGFNYAVNSFVKTYGYFGYTYSDYKFATSSRADDWFVYGIGAVYKPNRYLNFTAEYTYYDNQSSGITNSYTRHIVELKAELRY